MERRLCVAGQIDSRSPHNLARACILLANVRITCQSNFNALNRTYMLLSSMSVRFWGVRGSIPCPGPNTVRYGGNTSCVEVRCGESVLVFDAGSGLKLLGESLLRDGKTGNIDLFLSHGHIDHLIGLPFFAPLLTAGGRLRLWAGNLQLIGGLKPTVERLMSFPLFPIELGMLAGKFEFNDFRAGEELQPRSDIRLRTAALHHPGGATGYRLEYAGRSVAYLTDTECGNRLIDDGIVALAEGADLMIFDATYTKRELRDHRGWGHSSWQQGVRLAEVAGAVRLCLFHHDPNHDDNRMDEIAAAAEAVRPGTIVAREGLCVDL